MNDLSHTPVAAAGNIPDSRGINFFDSDPEYAALLRLHLGDAHYAALEPTLRSLGQRASDELDRWALRADKHPPVLEARTRRGEPLQRIDKHPDYVALERVAYAELGLAAMNHEADPPPPLVKYALTFLFVQAEFGLCCPVSMTDSLTHTLRRFGSRELVERYLPRLASRDFDTLFQGAMFMTEQAAGSDVGAIATRAVREGGRDGESVWRLYGDKWFCSNPDADLAMVLARPDDAPPGIRGLGLFLLPKTLPDGSRNAYRIVRLKDKLGSRSMASGEIALEGAQAWLIGEVGRGFHQMAEMINLSRLSNGVRAAGLMRRALTEALHVARHREAFGRRLIDMPLMRRQLLKMLLPAEQARSMFIHLAMRMGDAAAGDAQAASCVRVLTPLVKFRACRDARRVTGDAMEVRGGTGYIEEWSDARLVRDAHLGSIWEGTSNIVALDVGRAIHHDHALAPLRAWLQGLLDAARLPDRSRHPLSATLARTCEMAGAVAEARDDEHMRHAATALYNVTTAILMAVDGMRLAPDYRRLALAHLVLRHRLMPVDPLGRDGADGQDAIVGALLNDRAITLDAALRLVPDTGLAGVAA